MPARSRLSPDSREILTRSDPARPKWVNDSRLLTDADSLAERAHGSQTRPDGRTFLEHVVEVAGLLNGAGFDEEIVAAGLLHDSVERGTLPEEELRAEMGADIASLVLTLSGDPTIASFESRKAELRRQVGVAGGDAVTVYAASSSPTSAGCAGRSSSTATRWGSDSAPAATTSPTTASRCR